MLFITEEEKETVLFIIEEAKETALDFPQGTFVNAISLNIQYSLNFISIK